MKKKLMRITGKEAMMFGICAGIGEYFRIDPTIVRLLFLSTLLLSIKGALLAYLILFFVMPVKKEKEQEQKQSVEGGNS